jgi:hypothetical protein
MLRSVLTQPVAGRAAAGAVLMVVMLSFTALGPNSASGVSKLDLAAAPSSLGRALHSLMASSSPAVSEGSVPAETSSPTTGGGLVLPTWEEINATLCGMVSPASASSAIAAASSPILSSDADSVASTDSTPTTPLGDLAPASVSGDERASLEAVERTFAYLERNGLGRASTNVLRKRLGVPQLPDVFEADEMAPAESSGPAVVSASASLLSLSAASRSAGAVSGKAVPAVGGMKREL